MVKEFDDGRRKALLSLATLGLLPFGIACAKNNKSLVPASIPNPSVSESEPSTSIEINENGMNLKIILPEGFGKLDIGRLIYKFPPEFFDFRIGKSTSAPYIIDHFGFIIITRFRPESGNRVNCIFQTGLINDQKPRLNYNESYLMDDVQKPYLLDLSWKDWQIVRSDWYQNGIKVEPIKQKNPLLQKASWINHQESNSLI